MSFFRKKEKKELVLIFDIGSSSIGGAFVELSPSLAPKVIKSIREPIRLEEVLNVDRFRVYAMHTLHKVVKKMCDSNLGAPKRIFCVLASPWYASQTRVINYEKNASFIFTQKLADSLIASEIKIFEEEHGIDSEGTNTVRAIELRNMKTMLNGYTTSNPINQKATNLKMTIFVSMSEESVLAEIEEAIWRHFPYLEIKFSSFLVASFSLARDMFINNNSFLLINIGGEVTDIAIVKEDVLKEAATFPMGSHFITRGISKSLTCSIEDAYSSVMLYESGNMLQKNELVFQDSLKKLRGEWLAKFQATLSSLSSDISIPATVFITVDPSLAKFFSETIRTEQFNQYTLTESKFRLIFLNSSALGGIAEVPEETKKDPFIIIDSIYINRFLK